HIVDYLKALFEDNGYQTCTANDGEQALHVMEAERPDLVTLDLEMPNEWGPRFYRKFSQRDALKETPVIVISGLSGIHLAIRKAVATIQKPFEPDNVLKIVKETIG
ncbi:MAG: DVU0259 family response regulator domain-containing protein, partial [Desulfovibrionaceae bacterium]